MDELTFKDLFRSAFKHSLLKEEEVERWIKYRDNRNNTTGQAFAEKTLTLMDDFLPDVYNLKKVIEQGCQ